MTTPSDRLFFPDSVNADPEHLKQIFSYALMRALELIRTTGIGMLADNQRHNQTVKRQCLAEDEHDELFEDYEGGSRNELEHMINHI